MADKRQSLADIDRPVQEYACRAWDGLTVPMRRLAAADSLYFAREYVGMLNGESEENQVVRFYCELLARCVMDPGCDAAEWLRSARLATLTELGEECMRLNDLVPPAETNEQKKRRSKPGIDSCAISPSPSAAE